MTSCKCNQGLGERMKGLVDSCVGGWLQGEPRNSDSVIPKVPLTPHFKGTPPRVLSHNFVQGFDAQLYASFLAHNWAQGSDSNYAQILEGNLRKGTLPLEMVSSIRLAQKTIADLRIAFSGPSLRGETL